MNEVKLIGLLNEICVEAGETLEISTHNAPLVSIITYSITSKGLALNVTITKAASISSLNKNIALTFRILNCQFDFFDIHVKKGLLGFLTNKAKYETIGGKDQEIVRFFINELNKLNLTGVRRLQIVCSENSLNIQFKSFYLESLASMFSLLLKFLRKYPATRHGNLSS
jgi:hypothetical protein